MRRGLKSSRNLIWCSFVGVLLFLVALLIRYEIKCFNRVAEEIENYVETRSTTSTKGMRLRWEIEDLKRQILDLGASGPLPSNGFTLDNIAFDKRSCSVPKMLHATWSSSNVEARDVKNVRSWVEMNPDWEYKLWTDSDIRLLVARRFPTYLKMFDSYPRQIQRADMFRYFVMYEYGGVYVDMDFEALQPLSKILDDDLRSENEFQDSIDIVSTGSKSDKHVCCVVSQEPVVHAHVLYHVNRLACNAIIISAPGHPLWLHMIEYANNIWENAKDKSDVLGTTGPKMMNEALDAYMEARNHRESAPVHIFKPETFYPLFDDRSEFLKSKCESTALDKKCSSWKHMMSLESAERTCANRRDSCNWLKIHDFKNLPMGTYPSVAVHHWQHTWVGSSSSVSSRYSCNHFPIHEVISSPLDKSYGESIIKRAEECVSKIEASKHELHSHNGNGRPGLSEKCEDDRNRLCKDVKPGEGRTHKCMDSHYKDLSDACKLAEYGSLTWVPPSDDDDDDDQKEK